MAGKRTPASSVALGGVLAALAVVVMSLGTIFPIATYVCPMLCALLLQAVLKTCGVRIAWAWYGAVAILLLLLAPDKEAATVFAFLDIILSSSPGWIKPDSAGFGKDCCLTLPCW